MLLVFVFFSVNKRNIAYKLEQQHISICQDTPSCFTGESVFVCIMFSYLSKCYEAESAFKVIKHSFIVSHHICLQ